MALYDFFLTVEVQVARINDVTLECLLASKQQSQNHIYEHVSRDSTQPSLALAITLEIRQTRGTEQKHVQQLKRQVQA